jgi:hypothetical protein
LIFSCGILMLVVALDSGRGTHGRRAATPFLAFQEASIAQGKVVTKFGQTELLS